jgi:hypothetical protein
MGCAMITDRVVLLLLGEALGVTPSMVILNKVHNKR